jgi:hypothetical protein
MIHLVCQSQGGVGKTLISVLLTQYLRDRGHPVRAYDLDPCSNTFASFEALEVMQPDLWSADALGLNTAVFDPFLETLMVSQDEVVVDISSRAFLSWIAYLHHTDWVVPFQEAGQVICIHLAVVGGMRLRETVSDLEYHAEHFAPSCPLVVWLNDFFGPIVFKGVDFESMPAYEARRHHIQGLVYLPICPQKGYEDDMTPIFTDRLTFDACFALNGLGVMQKHRLRQFQQQLYRQLDVVLPIEAQASSGVSR